MAIISFIEAKDVIEKILKHLGLWEVKPRPLPRIGNIQPVHSDPWIDYAESQVVPFDNGFYVDPPASDPGAGSEYISDLSP